MKSSRHCRLAYLGSTAKLDNSVFVKLVKYARQSQISLDWLRRDPKPPTQFLIFQRLSCVHYDTSPEDLDSRRQHNGGLHRESTEANDLAIDSLDGLHEMQK